MTCACCAETMEVCIVHVILLLYNLLFFDMLGEMNWDDTS